VKPALGAEREKSSAGEGYWRTRKKKTLHKNFPFLEAVWSLYNGPLDTVEIGGENAKNSGKKVEGKDSTFENLVSFESPGVLLRKKKVARGGDRHR